MISNLSNLKPFNTEGWHSRCDTAPPQVSGIYIIGLFDSFSNTAFALYVGKAKNLQRRIGCHWLLRNLSQLFYGKRYVWSVVYYKEHNGDISALEKHWIRTLNPPLNSVGKEDVCHNAF